MTTRLLPSAALLLALSALPGPVVSAGAQIVVEDLEQDLETEMRTLLDEAVERFRSVDQPESIPILTRVVDQLSLDAAETASDPALVGILVRALALRAEALFNLGDESQARADLTILITIDPGFRLDPDRVSPKLVSMLDDLRRGSVGGLALRVRPADARILVDGVEVEAAGREIQLLAGDREVRVERPGYRPSAAVVRVEAGETVALETDLERVSPTLSFAVLPATAEVRIDGAPVERTAGAREGDLLVALEAGRHRVSVSAPGHRSRSLGLRTGRLADYLLQPIVLEAARGRIVVREIPEGSTLTLDGRPIGQQRGSEAALDLAPGPYRLELRAGARGSWLRTVTLADRQEIGLLVRLRPSLVLLGFAGPDRVAGTELTTRIADSLAGSERWAFASAATSDGRPDPSLGLAEIDWAHLGDEPWRIAALPPPGDGWTALQSRLDTEVGGSAYLLVTLRGAPYADAADLWLWSAASGPPRPWHRRLALASPADGASWLEALEAPLELAVPWGGVDLVDAPIGGWARVATVTPDGPAADAGLMTGDRIVSMDGADASVRRYRELLASHPSQLALGVLRGTVRTTLTLRPVAAPTVVEPSRTGLPDPALWALLACPDTPELATAPAWLVELQRALALLRANRPDAAAARLAEVAAPEREGVGRGTVDLWRGLALLETGRSGMAAARALERAAESSGRLSGEDGAPSVAPLARAWSRP